MIEGEQQKFNNEEKNWSEIISKSKLVASKYCLQNNDKTRTSYNRLVVIVIVIVVVVIIVSIVHGLSCLVSF